MTPVEQQLARAGQYSRFVGLMRWALPAAAVVLLLLLFVWPSATTSPRDLPQANSGFREMTNLKYTGLNAKNEPFSVTATRAVQQGSLEDMVQLSDVAGRLERTGGGWVNIASQTGSYDQKANRVQLTGAVHLTDDTGYDVTTELANIDLNTPAQASGDKPVNGKGPKGAVKANGFRITDEGKTVIFTGRARLDLPRQ